MSYDEDEGFEEGFGMNSYEDEEELSEDAAIDDFGLEEEDPESRYS